MLQYLELNLRLHVFNWNFKKFQPLFNECNH